MATVAPDAGTRVTLDRIARYIRAGAQSPALIGAARHVVANEPDLLRQLAVLREWVRRNWRMVFDPIQREYLRPPEQILTELSVQGTATGDCDEAAIFAGSLAGAIGAGVFLDLLGFGADGREAYHVYATGYDPEREQLIDFDITRPMQQPDTMPSRRWSVNVI